MLLTISLESALQMRASVLANMDVLVVVEDTIEAGRRV